MRARHGLVAGWVVVALFAVAAGAAAIVEIRAPDLDRPDERSDGAGSAAGAFIDAWERSRQATFVTRGTYERRSEASGAVIASEDVVAQRPPERIHRQLGGVDGRVDDRLVVCPAPPAGEEDEAQPCRLGEPGGPTYDESVAREVAGLRSILLGPAPLYTVAAGDDPGCYELDQARVDPRAPFGVGATFCFDEATGAPVARSVRHEGGVEEVLVVTEISTEVRDRDLDPAGG